MSEAGNLLSKIILLTGEPGNILKSLGLIGLLISYLKNSIIISGCGKTTLIKKIYDKLKENDFKSISGFYTEELRNPNNERIGFDVIDINQPEKRSVLARTR